MNNTTSSRKKNCTIFSNALRSSALFLLIVLLSIHRRFSDAFSLGSRITTTKNLNTPSGPPAYVIIEAKLNPSEMKRFASYANQVPSIVQKYGGEYIVLGGTHEPLEGEWGETRIVLHRWPNIKMAKEFWESEEYDQLKKVREGTGDFRIMLLEGLEEEDIPI